MPSAKKLKGKRKLNKGTEKLSPEEKRIKSIAKHFKMATSMEQSKIDSHKSSGNVTISDEKWQELIIKVENISKKTDEITHVRQCLDGMKSDIQEINKRHSEMERRLTIQEKHGCS